MIIGHKAAFRSSDQALLTIIKLKKPHLNPKSRRQEKVRKKCRLWLLHCIFGISEKSEDSIREMPELTDTEYTTFAVV